MNPLTEAENARLRRQKVALERQINVLTMQLDEAASNCIVNTLICLSKATF